MEPQSFPRGRTQARHALEVAGELEASFRKRRRSDGVEGERRLVEDQAAPTVGLHSRYADLAALGQENPDGQRLSGSTTVLPGFSAAKGPGG